MFFTKDFIAYLIQIYVRLALKPTRFPEQVHYEKLYRVSYTNIKPLEKLKNRKKKA